jgi:hypothetical protein
MNWTIIVYTVDALVAVFIAYWVIRFQIAKWARAGHLVTYRRQMKFTYRMRGGRPVKIFFSGAGITVDQKTGDVKEVKEGEEYIDDQVTLLERLFGVQWIGFDPFHLHKYPFLYDRLPRPYDDVRKIKGGYTLDKDTGIVSRRSETDYLAYRFVYPLVVEEVETRDGAEINLGGTITVQVCNAITPVFTLNGEWFPQVIDEAHGAVTEFLRQFDLIEFMGVTKTGETIEQLPSKRGKSSPPKAEGEPAETTPVEEIEEVGGRKIHSLLELIKQTQESTRKSTGMIIVSFNYREWNFSDKTIKKAARSLEEQELLAKGVIAKAKGEAFRIREVGGAEAEAAKLFVDAAASNAQGAQILIMRELAPAIQNHKGTLVLGNSPGTLVGIDPSSQTHPTEVVKVSAKRSEKPPEEDAVV